MAKNIRRNAAPQGASPSGAPAKAAGASIRGKRGGRVRAQLVSDFTIQLATLSEAGISVVKSLTILEGQTPPGPFKHVLADLVEDVSGGTPLSEAMAKHDRVFDELYTSMVRAGGLAVCWTRF
jgi:type II secretory pathway component PulF